jgi:phospholipase C
MEVPNALTGDHIDHVVVLVLENHSFDQMLGCMKAVYPQLEGIDPQNPRSNADDKGKPFQQQPTTERQMLLDPHHEVQHVAAQLAHGNSGFVSNFTKCYPDKGDRSGLHNGLLPQGLSPALHPRSDFTICDQRGLPRFLARQPNRFSLTGTSKGR